MNLRSFFRSAGSILAALLTVAAAGGATGFSWYYAQTSTDSFREDVLQRARDTARGLTASYAEQIGRQLLAYDQTLDGMVRALETDPAHFDLQAWKAAAISLNGANRDMFITDESGIIRQATVPEFLGQSAADLDVFRQSVEHPQPKPTMLVGLATFNPIMRQLHLDIVRTVHKPDGSFGGIIDAEYRVPAITALFQAANPPDEGFVALVGLSDGKLRASFGPRITNQGASIADSAMFAAVDAADSGVWVGPSSVDAAMRIHAFRHLPGRDLAVIAGVSQSAALAPVELWARQTRAYAAGVSALSGIIAILVIGSLVSARRRAARAHIVQTNLAAANALAEVSRAQREAVTRRLTGTFAAVNDGLAIFDAHLNLLEWNALFPERTGVNASFIRVGMPIEELFRAQGEAGAFGGEVEAEQEVERRAALLRAGSFGTPLTFTAGARFIELRCRSLAEGGFVALFTDLTESRASHQAIRDARSALEQEHAGRGRILRAVSHELRDRAGVLTRAIAAVSGGGPAAADVSGIALTADHVASLADQTGDMLALETGGIVPAPALLDVPALVRDAIERFRPIAADRGLTVWPVIDHTAPAEVIADPARLRELARLLLTEAVRLAEPDTIWLIADGGAAEERGGIALRLMVRCFGPPLPPDRRAAMFPPFDAIDIPAADDPLPLGTGLERAILGQLASVMGGTARCETWSTATGRTGNDLIVTLPVTAVRERLGRPPEPAATPVPDAPLAAPGDTMALPRTRVLLAGAMTGLRQAAMTLLRREGHLVDLVPTGHDAARTLAETPYDIAFLDSALPDQPLAAAAAAIRASQTAARTVPLIALAASYDLAHEQAWRAAGIVEILPDPPSFADLVEAIRRNVWQPMTAGERGEAITIMTDETEEGIPILLAERISELRDNIPAAELADMVEEAIADLQHRIVPLRRALIAAAPGTILSQAHAMVGVAAGYGMTVVAARLRAIMAAAKEGRLDTIDGASDMVEADLNRAAAALRRVLRISNPVMEARRG